VTTLLKQPDRLYDLLPALYRIADADQREALGALLKLVTEQADALRDDTQQLWDDFFIETCRSWVIPYIGELVGNTPLHDLDLSSAAATAESLFSDLSGPDLRPFGAIPTRADVAKTIHYRRRKGTPAMLEELARNVTGWGAHVVEFFTLLDWNQHLEHLRLNAPGCPDLRRVDLGDRVAGPWDTTTHTVDVRRINEWDGWYNLPNLGFFLWRIGAYRLTRVTPRHIGETWRLTFSPLGQNVPLFSAGRREPGESLMANEFTVKAPIRAAAFFEDLAKVPKPPPPTATTAYYGDPENPSTDASLVVFSDGNPVDASDVVCANLRNWPAAQPDGKSIYVDVTRGRLVRSKDGPDEPITVSYYYGFSAEMGGGEYDRRKWLVTATTPVTGGGHALHDALAARTGTKTVIEIDDDATYFLRDDIDLAQGESLTIQAKNQTRPHIWLGREPSDGSEVMNANGSVKIINGGAGASLTLNGLLIEGGLVLNGDLGALRILHTTLVPGLSVELDNASRPSGPSLVVAQTSTNNTDLELQIAFSIVGALQIPSHVKKLWILDSIVDGIAGLGAAPTIAVADAADASGPPAHIERSTLFGTSRFLKLELASESIFTGVVIVDQKSQGCVRFSYVPLTSVTPQKYRCQPALQIAIEEENKTGAAKNAVEAEVAQWLAPSFESVDYGRPEFAQLRRTCPVQIRTGAEDSSEMGAFCVLKQPQRESNLRIRLDEYLPVGLEAGIVYVT